MTCESTLQSGHRLPGHLFDQTMFSMKHPWGLRCWPIDEAIERPSSDVDIFDTNDVLWAMTTRYQGDRSTEFIRGVIGHQADPSQHPSFSPSTILGRGIGCKTIFDCTVPWPEKSRFVRAKFMDVDPEPFLTPSTKALEL